MNIKILKQSCALLLSASVLAACGGSGDDPAPGTGGNGDSGTQSLTFAYPTNGQTEIAGPAPVVLRFTDTLTLDAVNQSITLVRASDGEPVTFTPEIVGKDPRTVLIQPDDNLAPHTRYEVRIQGLALEDGAVRDQTLTFTTRALQRGPRDLVITSPDFELNRAFPSGEEQEPVMDFSTFRFQFSQPIDPATARYAQDGSVRLMDAEGDLVAARLLVDGPYMTLDPVDDYLTPGAQYTLYLEPELASTYGESFEGEDFRFQPKDSSPNREPVFLVQKITEPELPDDPELVDPNEEEDERGLSSLTGKPINQVPVNSTLLGQDSATQSSGNVRAELASTVSYPNITPIRIPRETLLTGTNIDVMIGGAVPAGIRSGDVKMHFLSDATGYMVPNPYDPDGLRVIKLFMDVAIATEKEEANGGFTQDLLHIELVGLSEILPDEGALSLDAVSMVEPDVLGQEFANGLLSFQLRSYKDQTNPPAPTVDNAAPTLQSWTFGEDGATGLDKTAMVKPTDPIILNFSEPLDRDTVEGKVHLYKNEGGTQTEMNAEVTVDGGAIVIKPAEPLEHPTETGPSLEYQVSIDPGVTDLSGEPWIESFDETFGFGTQVEEYERYTIQGFGANAGIKPTGQIEPVRERSPYILGLYPGYPCPLTIASRDLASGKAGRCRGGMQPNTAMDDMPGEDNLGALEPLPADDVLPVPDMPSNRPIIVVFSKPIDRNSLFDNQGNTPAFQVYKIDAASPDNHSASVSGTVTLEDDTLRFVPNQPWEDGQLYGYTLQSNDDMTSSTAQCDANQPTPGLCGVQGLPLKTQVLEVISTHDQAELLPDANPPIFKLHFLWSEEQPLPTGGGPTLTQYFTGAPPTKDVLQLLRLPQPVDRNNNLLNDSTAYKFDTLWPVQGGSTNYATYSSYEINENGDINWQPDTSTEDFIDPVSGLPLDPNGVKPPANSAKVLSAFYSYRDMEPILNHSNSLFTDYLESKGANSGLGNPAFSLGANIGCGFNETLPFPDQTDCDVYGQGFFGKSCSYAIPEPCPHEKFTYLHGVLFADVTDQVTQDGDIKVKIYPGHITTTSFRIFLKSGTGTGGEIADSEYQVMRMRYPSGEQYITGWITAEPRNGRTPPVLYTSLDLYLDAPLLSYDLVQRKRIVSTTDHNQRSYPVSMDLSGSVNFLSDGRMVAEQYNDTPIEVNVLGNTPSTNIDLLIPKGGSFLRYVSEPIK